MMNPHFMFHDEYATHFITVAVALMCLARPWHPAVAASAGMV
jgi:hypothetical protein